MNQYKKVQFHIDNYTLVANYCTHSLKKGGMCIFVHNCLNFVGVDLENFSNDQGIEACTIILFHNSYNICIPTIYRAPTGNLTCFIKKLETILCSLHTLNTQFTICGDINVNYLANTSRRKTLAALLSLFNLSGTLYFPTNLQNKSATAIDNIFIDTSKFANYVISALYNGLPAYDAQLITLNDIDMKIQNSKFKIIRRIDTYSILDSVIR